MNRQRLLAMVLIVVLLGVGYYQGRRMLLPPLQKRVTDLTKTQGDLQGKRSALETQIQQAEERAKKAAPSPQGNPATPKIPGDDVQKQFADLSNVAEKVSGAVVTSRAPTRKALGGTRYEVKISLGLKGSMKQMQNYITYIENWNYLLRVSNVVLSDQTGTLDVTTWFETPLPVPGAQPATPAPPAKQ